MSLPQKRKGAWSGIWMGPRLDEGTGAGVYRWDLRKGIAFSLVFHTTIFQA